MTFWLFAYLEPKFKSLRLRELNVVMLFSSTKKIVCVIIIF